MAYETIIYEKKDRIARITLNRPQVMNAMNRKMNRELAEVWDDFNRDTDAWIAIITGAGDKAFSSGADLKDQYVEGRKDIPDQFWAPARGGVGPGAGIWKPIIAAINGYCLAGGLEVALTCDLRIASDNARFGMSEVLRSLVPGGGGVQRLPRQIPYVLAMELLLTGDMIDAQEAYRIGLVNKVVPPSELMPAAEEMAQKIARNGPLCVRAIKESLVRGMDLPLEHALRMNSLFTRINLTTEDSAEGPLAFTEKRPPNYKGR
jgi:E-phenylitaconyl-CoA hydratase